MGNLDWNVCEKRYLANIWESTRDAEGGSDLFEDLHMEPGWS